MVLVYAGIPAQLGKPILTIISGTITTAISGNIYLQARNRQGYNLFSQPESFSITAGQGLAVTIPDCSDCGWEVWEYIISYSSTTYVNSSVLATYSGKDILPGVVNLTHDYHFIINGVVSSEASLPGDRIRGMRRLITNLGVIKEYDGSNWIDVYPNSFSSLVSSTTSQNAYEIPINLISDKRIIKIPKYGASGNQFSEAVTFWIKNNTSTSISAGKSIRVELTWGDVDLTDLFFAAGAVYLTFNGFINTSNGAIDTTLLNGGTMGYIGTRYQYTSNVNGLILEKDLPTNWAYSVSVELKTDVASLNGRIGNLAEISIDIKFSEAIGIYSGIARILGDLINPDGGKRLIVPGISNQAKALSGSGAVKGRAFVGVSEQTIIGLQLNTANQLIAINGNGTCTVETTITPSYQTLRAKVGTLNGVGKLVQYETDLVLDTTKSITLNIKHIKSIREDYSDKLLRGISDGIFNPYSLKAYLVSSTITEYDLSILPSEDTELFTLTGSNGTVLTQLPNTELGLYKPEILGVTINNSGSTFTSGTYTLYIGYYYQDTVTYINNQANDKLMNLEGTLIEEIHRISLINALIFG